MLRAVSIAVISALTFGTAVLGQTTLNPDISLIPRFSLHTNDGEELDQGERHFSKPEFNFEELEVAISAYLNPFAKADVFLTLPGPDTEEGRLGIEEIYATILRGLPLDLNVRLGKYRVEFGKINMMHPHQWPFVNQPISQERFLGEEGLNDLGLSASVLLPTGDIYTRLTVDILKGSAIGEATGIEDTSGETPAYANSARLMGFFTVGDNADLELGASIYTGIHDPYSRLRFWYTNVDFKYKYKPSSYTSLTLQGEFLYNTRRARQDRDLTPLLNANGDPELRRITSWGGYLFADFQFEKIYSLGSRLDLSQSPYSRDETARGIAIFLGYYPVEETLGVRLQYQHTRNATLGHAQSVNSIGLQVLFSLGPHKAHTF